MSGPVEALVGLGSNLGDRRAQLDAAVEALDATPGLVVAARSPWIETAPEGGPPDQPPFLNGVVALEASLPARALLERLLAIEAAAGRDRAREPRNGPRTLDLDLLFYGREHIVEPGLVVPHPRLERRTFVLEPLSHLAPDRHLPGCRRSVLERLAELEARARGARLTRSGAGER